ncbi:MAG: hypothetical protein JWQ14_3168, partial [Adhaeribacter sp.]|nr:hypothetical protein [Adhaeribacter sp.]
LSVLPKQDTVLHQAEPRDERYCACLQCGNLEKKENTKNIACKRCGCQEWTYAVKQI